MHARCGGGWSTSPVGETHDCYSQSTIIPQESAASLTAALPTYHSTPVRTDSKRLGKESGPTLSDSSIRHL